MTLLEERDWIWRLFPGMRRLGARGRSFRLDDPSAEKVWYSRGRQDPVVPYLQCLINIDALRQAGVEEVPHICKDAGPYV